METLDDFPDDFLCGDDWFDLQMVVQVGQEIEKGCIEQSDAVR